MAAPPDIATLLPAMPTDMLVHIFAFLPVEEQARADGVSVSWRAGLGGREALWAALLSTIQKEHAAQHRKATAPPRPSPRKGSKRPRSGSGGGSGGGSGAGAGGGGGAGGGAGAGAGAAKRQKHKGAATAASASPRRRSRRLVQTAKQRWAHHIKTYRHRSLRAIVAVREAIIAERKKQAGTRIRSKRPPVFTLARLRKVVKQWGPLDVDYAERGTCHTLLGLVCANAARPLPLAKELVARMGADVNVISMHGLTPLTNAAVRCCPRLVAFLLAQPGIDTTPRGRCASGWTGELARIRFRGEHTAQRWAELYSNDGTYAGMPATYQPQRCARMIHDFCRRRAAAAAGGGGGVSGVQPLLSPSELAAFRREHRKFSLKQRQQLAEEIDGGD